MKHNIRASNHIIFREKTAETIIMEMPLIEKIEELVRTGRHAEAKSSITAIKKLGLTDLVRLKCSDWYLRLGFPNAAIKIIGREFLGQELRTATVDALMLQARLAYMLGYFGADQSANRVAKKIEPYINKSREFASQFYRYRAGNCLRVYNYAGAAESYWRCLDFLDPEKDFYQYQMMLLGFSDGLEGTGQSEKAIEIATQVIGSAKAEQVILRAIGHQARGEYYLKCDRFEEARADFAVSWELFPKDVKSRDYGFLAKWSGALSLLTGDRVNARISLDIAYQILSNDKLRPTNVLEVLFWRYQLNKKDNTWVLNTHPSKNPYAYLTGRRCEEPWLLHPWIAKQLPKLKTSNDSWLLENGGVKVCAYKNEVKKSKNKTIDLVAGVIYGGNHYQVLSELKTRCLSALVSASYLGLSDWALIDLVYEGEWQVPESMVIRLNDLIKQLRLMGFKVVRRKNQYFYEPPKNMRLVMPMDGHYRGPAYHLRQIKRNFKRSDLEKLYGIKSAAAKIWLREWIESGLILSEEKGRNVGYKFLNINI